MVEKLRVVSKMNVESLVIRLIRPLPNTQVRRIEEVDLIKWLAHINLLTVR